MFRGPASFYEEGDWNRMEISRRAAERRAAKPKEIRSEPLSRQPYTIKRNDPFKVTAILNAVAHESRMTVDDIKSPSMKHRFIVARLAFCWLARKHTTSSLPHIGSIIGRDHTTVLSGINRVEKHWGKFAFLITAVESRIEGLA